MERIGGLPRYTHDGSLAPRTDIEREAMRSYDDDFVVRMTKYSAEIEGSKLQLHDTKLVIDGEFVPCDDKELQDLFAVRGVYEGYLYAMGQMDAGRDLASVAFLQDVHERTALDLQPAARGSLRRAPAIIQASQTEPFDANDIRPALDDLVFQLEASDAHPLVRIAAFHAAFENIHPFSDGNGRAGRNVMNAMLAKEGYPPIALKEGYLRTYAPALEAWQVDGDPSDFMGIFLACLEEEASARYGMLEKCRAL